MLLGAATTKRELMFGALVSLGGVYLFKALFRNKKILNFKTTVFGILIADVCATQGYETEGGAKEVGISTTQAAIKSTIYMLIADFIINFVFYL